MKHALKEAGVWCAVALALLPLLLILWNEITTPMQGPGW